MLKLKSRSDIHQILAITDIDENRDRGFLEKHVQKCKKCSNSQEDDESETPDGDDQSKNLEKKNQFDIHAGD